MNEAPESDGSNDNANDIGIVVAISGDVASSTTVDATVFFDFKNTGEWSGDRCDIRFEGADIGSRDACCLGEDVDEFEEEEFRECAAKV